jgi:hypothetical protein
MLWGVTYPKFSPGSRRNKLLKFEHCRAKKWNNCKNIQQLNMPLGEHIGDDMRDEHAKFYEFSIHRKVDINLSLFLFYEICTIGEYESRRFEYMTIKVLFKGFEIYFIIFVRYILFSMNFQAS